MSGTHHFQHPRVQPLVGSRWHDYRTASVGEVVAVHGARIELRHVTGIAAEAGLSVSGLARHFRFLPEGGPCEN